MADSVVDIQIDHAWLEIVKLVIGKMSIGTNNNAVSHACLMGGCTVDADDPFIGLGAHGVGCKTLAIGDVINMDLLVFFNTRKLQ